jgi:hypothetical protein
MKTVFLFLEFKKKIEKEKQIFKKSIFDRITVGFDVLTL